MESPLRDVVSDGLDAVKIAGSVASAAVVKRA